MPENICCACISVGKISSRWWSLFVPYTVVLMLLTFPTCSGSLEEGANLDSSTAEFVWAVVNLTYIDPQTKQQVHETTKGKYGTTSLVKARTGLAVHVRNKDNKTHGCDEYAVKIPKEKWIALVERGHCYFTDKINQATKVYNASAVVIYNNEGKDEITIMQHSVKDQVSIFVSLITGRMLAELADQGVRVMMTITPGQKDRVNANPHNSISKTSILFVSISFIVLMIISLAWLVFYYIQRFRYAHAKERLARRLASAAKKAIAKIPQKTVKNGDRELDSEFDQCAVCIETYKPHEVIRTLPCKHVFHKTCVDPWLLDQRSCPMCKLDILRAYGMQVFGSQESVHQDAESGTAAAGPAEDHEHSSTTDDQPNADTEVKVLLLPHTCLHFHSHSSAVVSGGAAAAAAAGDASAAAAGASSASTSSSSSSSDDHHHPLPCLVRSSASAERLSRGAGGSGSCGRNDLETQALMSGSGDEEEEDVVVRKEEEEEEGLHEHPTPPCRVHRGRGNEDCAGEGPRNLGDGGGDFCRMVQLPQRRDGKEDSGEC